MGIIRKYIEAVDALNSNREHLSQMIRCALFGHYYMYEGTITEDRKMDIQQIGRPVYVEKSYNLWVCKYCNSGVRSPVSIAPSNNRRKKFDRINDFIDRILE